MSILIIIVLSFVLSSSALALDVEFDFNNSLADASEKYTAVNYVFTDEDTIRNDGLGFQNYTSVAAFGSDGARTYVSLAKDDYLGIPTSIPEVFDASQPIQFNVQFKFDVVEPVEAPSPCCPSTIYRSVLTTTPSDQRNLGFSLVIVKEEENYYLVLNVGDGSYELEGYRKFLDEIFPDTWIDLSLIFRLGDERPRVELFYEGIPIIVRFSEEKLNVAALIEHLEGGAGLAPNLGVSQMQLFLGGFPVADPRGADIGLDIDQLTIQSPRQAADAAQLREILTSFTQHVTGGAVLGTDELQTMLQTFFADFNGEWDDISDEALAYFSAYEAANDPLFIDNIELFLASFTPEALLTFYLQQWVFDNLFTAGSVTSVAGIKFESSEKFPGIVDSTAPRVIGEVQIDASYKTDPAIKLNNQETVFRPTGYYAPPGEPITIEVSGAAAAAGLQVRIGIHRFDLEHTFSYFKRFPRISNVFDINNTSTMVANPFGGGIYFEVPDGTDIGVIDVVINDAVKMPMFSTLDLTGHSQILDKFREETGKWHVPWFELHSPNFSATLPMGVAALYEDPAAVLTVFNTAFDEVNRMAGRPLKRFRSEWFAYDRQITYIGTALAASYPIFPDQELGARLENWASVRSHFSPLLLLQPDFFETAQVGHETLWHEWGHLHNLPTLRYEEQESNVHLLATIVYNQVLDTDIDTALRQSGFQHYDRDDAALDVMFSPNWQLGKRLSYDDWDNELRYQTRSWARLVEIAGLYGWDSVGAIHAAFYQRGVTDGKAYNYGITDDDFIETGSAALNMNLAPIFEFWGIPPSPELAKRLQKYPIAGDFRTRLLHYQTLVPETMAAFIPIYDKLVATTGVRDRWDYFLENFNEELGNLILNRIRDIDCRYYDCDGPNISVDNTSHDFGTVAVDSASQPKTFTVFNTGNADLVLNTLNITGTDSAVFNLQSDNCSGQTITPSGSCTVEVVFAPTVEAAASANLSIPPNDSYRPTLVVPLSGTGITCKNPTPNIKANGSDNTITTGTDDTLSITVSLCAGDSSGAACDWWVVAATPFGMYYFDTGIMNWVYAGDSYTDLSPANQGPLFDLSTIEVLNMTGLLAGTYTFYFAVDANMNGVLDFDSLYYDSVVVNITP